MASSSSKSASASPSSPFPAYNRAQGSVTLASFSQLAAALTIPTFAPLAMARDNSSASSSSYSEGGSDGYVDNSDSETEDVETGESSPSSSRNSVIAVNSHDPCDDQLRHQTSSRDVATSLDQSLMNIEDQQFQADESSSASSPTSSGFSLDRGSSSPSTISSAATSLSFHQLCGRDDTSDNKGQGRQATSSSPPRRSTASASLAHARSLLEHQAASLLSAARRMREEEETWQHFEGAQKLVVDTLKAGGKIVWTGVGKSGIIASKLSSTSLSLGLPSTYLDPLSALHGDLGLLNGAISGSSSFASSASSSQLPSPPTDVMIALSHSGSSAELLALLPHVRLRGVKVIALTAQRDSSLGQAALKEGGSWIDCRTAGRGDEKHQKQQQQLQQRQQFDSEDDDDGGVRLPVGSRCCPATSLLSASLCAALTAGTDEADPDLPAPSSSTTTALAMGDSLVLSCAKMLGLGTTTEFGKNHPGGALGQRMMAELKMSQADETEERREQVKV